MLVKVVMEVGILRLQKCHAVRPAYPRHRTATDLSAFYPARHIDAAEICPNIPVGGCHHRSSPFRGPSLSPSKILQCPRRCSLITLGTGDVPLRYLLSVLPGRISRVRANSSIDNPLSSSCRCSSSTAQSGSSFSFLVTFDSCLVNGLGVIVCLKY